MLNFLEGIYNFISNLGGWLLYGIITAINAIVAGLAAFVQGLLDGISVGMPTAPTLPSTFSDILSWVAWVFPVHTVVQIAIFYAAAWIMWWLLSIALRWVRAES